MMYYVFLLFFKHIHCSCHKQLINNKYSKISFGYALLASVNTADLQKRAINTHLILI